MFFITCSQHPERLLQVTRVHLRERERKKKEKERRKKKKRERERVVSLKELKTPPLLLSLFSCLFCSLYFGLRLAGVVSGSDGKVSMLRALSGATVYIHWESKERWKYGRREGRRRRSKGGGKEGWTKRDKRKGMTGVWLERMQGRRKKGDRENLWQRERKSESSWRIEWINRAEGRGGRDHVMKTERRGWKSDVRRENKQGCGGNRECCTRAWKEEWRTGIDKGIKNMQLQ